MFLCQTTQHSRQMTVCIKMIGEGIQVSELQLKKLIRTNVRATRPSLIVDNSAFDLQMHYTHLLLLVHSLYTKILLQIDQINCAWLIKDFRGTGRTVVNYGTRALHIRLWGWDLSPGWGRRDGNDDKHINHQPPFHPALKICSVGTWTFHEETVVRHVW